MRRYLSGEAFIYENINFEEKSETDCNLSLNELGETEDPCSDDSSDDEYNTMTISNNLMSLKDVMMPLSPSMKLKKSHISQSTQDLKASR